MYNTYVDYFISMFLSPSSGHSSSHHGRDKKDKYSRPSYEIDWTSMYTPDEYLDKDIADKVTSEWKVIYKECSARDPEAVTDIFKSVMGVFDEVGVRRFDDDERGHHDSERLKPCVIL